MGEIGLFSKLVMPYESPIEINPRQPRKNGATIDVAVDGTHYFMRPSKREKGFDLLTCRGGRATREGRWDAEGAAEFYTSLHS